MLWQDPDASAPYPFRLSRRLKEARQLRAAADLSRAVAIGAQMLADLVRVLGEDHPIPLRRARFSETAARNTLRDQIQ